MIRAVETPSRDELRAWTAALTRGPLDPSDPNETRYVELRDAGRGAVKKMLATIDLSLDTTTQPLSGPTGSGKTTELNRLRGELADDGYQVAGTLAELREAVSRRVPVDRIFDDPRQVDRLIEASGGHLRDLFIILQRLVSLIYRGSLPLPVADSDIEQAIIDAAHPFGQMTKE